ncbi:MULTISPECIES: type I-E CRISPR-associated protein Cas6/Cse3/CasE [Mycolicibacter]|uniref:Type I-E CRISPR-associated protein Cas6/Cse3/CasE n=2 Tax=Mycolicibacter TaxID=1073531 RepID=A0ABU5XQN4_9MYCO|nr:MULTISPECIES: type I-E CRISPR-associated protein Cas6/Cse3/CasE [unclassified Mycolicibacter]MEB3023396.1 type I-E CRISPR-associated protein Cas6/Cse3/CasE [Mycolicibacter sp. MYC098]MEB3033738.1 type I-E CRISPR-associated protein Cas6/Cse3/CasE [Mycolicibacter sp. MYC340]
MTPTASAVAPASEELTVLTTMITLDLHHPAARAILTDAHRAHRLTMSGFAHLLDKYDFFTGISGGHPDHRRALNVLFAINGRRTNDTLVIRLQSDAEPRFANSDCDWWRDAIHPDYPPATKPWRIPATGDIAYQIRANPITRVNGKRRAITTPDKQAEWWITQAAKSGLHLHHDPEIDQPLTLEFPSKRHHDKNKPELTVNTLRYTGTATITDPDTYRKAITHGIGRGLPYGAGLLLTMTKR